MTAQLLAIWAAFWPAVIATLSYVWRDGPRCTCLSNQGRLPCTCRRAGR